MKIATKSIAACAYETSAAGPTDSKARAWPAVVRPVRRTKLRIVRGRGGSIRVSGAVSAPCGARSDAAADFWTLEGAMWLLSATRLHQRAAGVPPGCCHCPVAVTPHNNVNAIVALAGKVSSSSPAGVSKFGHCAAAGQTAATGALDGVQEVTVQLSPALGTSLTRLLLAAVEPLLVKVTV